MTPQKLMVFKLSYPTVLRWGQKPRSITTGLPLTPGPSVVSQKKRRKNLQRRHLRLLPLPWMSSTLARAMARAESTAVAAVGVTKEVEVTDLTLQVGVTAQAAIKVVVM